MSFNKKERERAKQEQWAAQENAKRIAAQEEAYAGKVRSEDEARMKGIEALGQRALGRVEAIDKGDIGSAYASPMMAAQMKQAAQQYQTLNRQPGALGKDPRYMERLGRQQKGQFLSNLAGAQLQGIAAQRAADVGEASGALGMAQGAGMQRLGTYQPSMSSAGQLFGQAGNLREAALAQSQASFGNLMAGINTALGATSAISGVSQARSLSKIAGQK